MEVIIFILWMCSIPFVIVVSIKYAFKARKIELKLRSLLKLSFFEYFAYLKNRLPWGGLTRNFDNLYDDNDTEELRNQKTLYIEHRKKGDKILLFIFLFFGILFLITHLS